MNVNTLRPTLCADCTANHAVVTVHRSGTCRHSSDTAFSPLRRADIDVPAESLSRSPRLREVELCQLFIQGRALYRRLTRRDAWQLLGRSVDHASYQIRTSWGGGTYDPDGVVLPSTGYAVAIRPRAHRQVSVSFATMTDDLSALTLALQSFTTRAPYVGVFRDDLSQRIDIDPVAIVESRREADALGVYCGSTGGAYNYADGLGYWAPVL